MINLDEIKSREILNRIKNYEGNNPYIKHLKNQVNKGELKLTDGITNYIKNNYDKEPLELNNVIGITPFLSEELQKKYELKTPITKVLVEYYLGESELAYHVIGKFYKNQEESKTFWLPKTQLSDDIFYKKSEVIVDFDKYINIDKSKRIPYEYQKEGVKFLLERKKCVLADDMGLGKAEFIENKVFTPYGRKKIGDLNVGDEVIGSDGKSCNVTGVFPQGIKDLYKITFNDGYSILVCKEHLWEVTDSTNGKNSNKSRTKKHVLSVEQMLDENLEIITNGEKNNLKKEYKIKTFYKRNGGNNSKWQIPIVEPIEFKNNFNFLINPYLLGLLLGDGCFSGNFLGFTTKDEEIIEEIKKMIPNTIEINKTKNRIYDYRLIKNCKKENELIKELKILNLFGLKSHEKFIPEIYKYSSIKDRLSIIQGLMDTDGTCNKYKNNVFEGTEYSTTSEKLADDLIEIVQSLGGIARKRSRITFYKYKGEKKQGKISYRINIKLPENMVPFKLKRKLNQYVPPKKYKVGRYIKNIEYYGKGEALCISVSSKNKLYVTEHAIVTHNTYQTIVAAIESGLKKVLIICPASLKLNWKKELLNFVDESEISVIQGSNWEPKRFTIINYDILKKFHTVIDKRKNYKDWEISKNILDEGFDLLVLDEAHSIKNSNSNRSKIVLDIKKHSNFEYVWLLTGTPIANRPINYYNLLRLIDSPLGENWQFYVTRYCNGKQIRLGKTNKKFWLTTGSSNLDELSQRTRSFIVRRTKEQHLDLPDKIRTPIFIELENRKEYDKVFEKYIEWRKLNGKSTNVARKLVELTLLRKFLAIEKTDYTIELVDNVLDQDKKVIIFTNYKEEMDIFVKKYGKSCVTIHGGTKMEDRQKNVESFQNDDNIKVFVGQIMAAGVGLTLTKAEVVVFNSLDWVPGNLEQAEDRAYRISQTKNVNVYYPIFDNTVDMIVWQVLNKKKQIINQIMDDSGDSFVEIFKLIDGDGN